MTTTNINNTDNQAPYLRTSRSFTKDIDKLTLELGKSYIDIANVVNFRTIGIFPTNKPITTGESWFLTSQRQQTFRQIYTFTGTGNVPHGINFSNVSQFTKPTGSFTDGTNWYGAFYASNTAVAGQVTFYITSANIVILSGAGAPTISSGTIVLEWLSSSNNLNMVL